MASKMHEDEIHSDVDVVRRLLEAQQPQWAGLPIEPVASTGTDNALYRLGDDMVVRLPLRPSSIRPLDKEHRWLSVLAPHLPLAIPVPLAKGEPIEGYPWRWSVYLELFDAESREVLPTELGVDDATSARGRGWALSTAIVALPYYQHNNAFMAAQARHKLAVVLSE